MIESADSSLHLGLAGVVGAFFTKAADWLIGYRKSAAEAKGIEAGAKRTEAEIGQLIGDEYRQLVKQLRDDMRAERERCDHEISVLRTEVSALEARMGLQNRIIAALVYRRQMDAEARTLLMEIAPGAEPDFGEKQPPEA